MAQAQASSGGLPIALITFIAGAVFYWGIDGYDTLGLVLMIIGGALTALGIVFGVLALFLVNKAFKNVSGGESLTDLFRDQDRRATRGRRNR